MGIPLPVGGLPIGTTIQEYRIKSVVGEGGFAIVYLADDISLDREVAIKEYMPAALAVRDTDARVGPRSASHGETFAKGLRSFINEARMLARFKHPALIDVLRFWTENGTAYMAMPYYRGKTLRQLAREPGKVYDEAGLRRLIEPILNALDVMHRDNCFHRDISTDNIIVLSDGNPVLLDFGAARRIVADPELVATIILKPGFAPIEQYSDDLNAAPQGPWTDIYALAAVCYFLISGRMPIASVARIVRDSVVPLSSMSLTGYSPNFLRALDHALSVRPVDRPQTVREFLDLLGSGDVSTESASPSLVVPISAHIDTSLQKGTTVSVVSAEPIAARKPKADKPKADKPKAPKDSVVLDTVPVGVSFPAEQAVSDPLTIPYSVPIATPMDIDLLVSAPGDSASTDANTMPERDSPGALSALRNWFGEQSNLVRMGGAIALLLVLGVGLAIYRTTSSEASAPLPPSVPVMDKSEKAVIPIPVDTPPHTTAVPPPPIEEIRPPIDVPPLPPVIEREPPIVIPPPKGATDVQPHVKPRADVVSPGKLGVVVVAVKPWGQIVIDGESVGTVPPVRRVSLTPGMHEVIVEHPTAGKKAFQLDVKPGGTVWLNHTFDNVGAGQPKPPTSAVDTNYSPLQIAATVGNAPSQTSGKTAVSTTPATSPAQNVPIENQAKAKKPLATGEVRLYVTPSGKVAIDGEVVGMTPPLRQIRLAPGTHTMAVTNPTSAPFYVEFEVVAGRTTPIFHDFTARGRAVR